MTPWRLMAVADERWPATVEVKALLWASLRTLGSTLTSKEMMDGCYCATSSSSLYHTATSFHDSIVDYCSPPGCPLRY
uniref:Uncharacterized protein n=1 Tax=Oryza glumipatula TaxID=40148 RepID=A0A0D9YBS3_9ORYZ